MKHLIFLFALLLSHNTLNAHCQIPCGIYHDQMIVQGLEEDVETLMKSVNEIQKNSRRTAEDNNQLVRWVLNKEKHADKLADTLVEYFLKQRIKPDAVNLDKKLKGIHSMLVLSMKIKQTVDPKNVDALNQELHSFIAMMYPEQEAHTHH